MKQQVLGLSDLAGSDLLYRKVLPIPKKMLLKVRMKKSVMVKQQMKFLEQPRKKSCKLSWQVS